MAAGDVASLLESPKLLKEIQSEEPVALMFVSPSFLSQTAKARGVSGDAVLELHLEGKPAAVCVAAQMLTTQVRLACWLGDEHVVAWLTRSLMRGFLPVVLVCAEDTSKVGFLPLPFERVTADRLATLCRGAMDVASPQVLLTYIDWLRQLAKPDAVVVPGLAPAQDSAAFALATGSDKDVTKTIRAFFQRLH